MVVTTVMVSVKPENVQAFIKASALNHENSIKEPGNRRFDVLQNKDNPTEFLLYEAYDSEEAAAQHKKSAHYIQWRDTVASWMSKPRTGISYTAIRP